MGTRVEYFDLWQAGYAGASVAIYAAGTTTLLSVYSDEALTILAANPQTLQSMSQDGRSFGKFANPIYVGAAYELSINGGAHTGVITPPITALQDQDASAMLVTAAGSASPHYLYDIVARSIDVLDSGDFLPTSDPSASSATNNATLVAAIGKAAALGGGFVRVPADVFAFTTIAIPARVVVVGQGRDVTTLQSQVASKAVTLSGEQAGFKDITIDGVILGAGSIGVFSKRVNRTIFDNVTIKRFYTDLSMQGGKYARWKDLYIDNAVNGAILKGDYAASSDSVGDEFHYNKWEGGAVSNCTGIGVWLGFVDASCKHTHFDHIQLSSNTGTAMKITGARWTRFSGCQFADNGTDLAVEDGSDVSQVAINRVIGLNILDAIIRGAMTFSGLCQDVLFDRSEFFSGTYTLTDVSNPIITRDCVESSDVTLAGNDATQWMRTRSSLGDSPNSAGVTTDAVATEAWSYDLAPGERIFMDAKVVANGRNVIDYAVYHITQGAHRTGSTLAYDNQTSNFTLGDIVTGTTSGAVGRIMADADAGATGTLTLRDITGEFVDDESITGASGGAALANGVLAHQNAALLGTINTPSAAVESDATWACIFAVTARKARVLVTGAAGKTIDWTVAVSVTSG